MKVRDCVQGTNEWMQMRLGIPTASCFDMIVTPLGKLSKSADRYLNTLVAERITGAPSQEFVSTWMDRGSQTEAEAVAYYELQRDCETEKIGFVTNDAGTIGASPDRLVGASGLLEIKVPAPHTHVGYLLAGAKATVDRAYYPQVQGQLWIMDREWDDIISYHPQLPEALIRVERDEEFIGKLKTAVEQFAERLDAAVRLLVERGVIEKPELDPALYVTEQDAEILAERATA